jgi:hypothetical protein
MIHKVNVAGRFLIGFSLWCLSIGGVGFGCRWLLKGQAEGVLLLIAVAIAFPLAHRLLKSIGIEPNYDDD